MMFHFKSFSFDAFQNTPQVNILAQRSVFLNTKKSRNNPAALHYDSCTICHYHVTAMSSCVGLRDAKPPVSTTIARPLLDSTMLPFGLMLRPAAHMT